MPTFTKVLFPFWDVFLTTAGKRGNIAIKIGRQGIEQGSLLQIERFEDVIQLSPPLLND